MSSEAMWRKRFLIGKEESQQGRSRGLGILVAQPAHRLVARHPNEPPWLVLGGLCLPPQLRLRPTFRTIYRETSPATGADGWVMPGIDA
jgi:hypothetical protein